MFGYIIGSAFHYHYRSSFCRPVNRLQPSYGYRTRREGCTTCWVRGQPHNPLEFPSWRRRRQVNSRLAHGKQKCPNSLTRLCFLAAGHCPGKLSPRGGQATNKQKVSLSFVCSLCVTVLIHSGNDEKLSFKCPKEISQRNSPCGEAQPVTAAVLGGKT